MKSCRIVLLFGLLATGCGGGGASDDVLIQSFEDAPADGDLVVSGTEARQTFDSSGSASIVTGSPSVLQVNFVFSNAADELNAIRLANGETLVSTDTVGGFVSLTDGGSNFLLVSDPALADAQVHGAGFLDAGSIDSTMIAIVAGFATPVANIPSMTGATYMGSVTGILVDDSGDGFLTSGDVAISTTNFTSVTLEVSNSNKAALAGGSAVAASELDFVTSDLPVGEGSYAGTFASGGFSGDIEGTFFGSGASETGGVISGFGSAGDFLAAFGAR